MLARSLWPSVVLMAVLAWPILSPAAEHPVQRPNVILFLIDDLGWTDLGCFGSDFYETPNIDRLAEAGMRFTDAYTACTVCSPTRAAVMTGKYPARLHLTDWIAGHQRTNPKLLIPDWTQHLPLEEVTLAEALKAAGYATAHVGKWHLGNEPYYPEHQGFDLNVGGDRWGSPPSYFWPYRQRPSGKSAGRAVPLDGGRPGEYLTDRLTDEAIRFINSHRDTPFFLYFAHYAVHTPLQAKKELIARYQAKLDGVAQPPPAVKNHPGQPRATVPQATRGQQCPVYAAMIHSVDESVGRIVEELRKQKLDDRTVILFTSDNGGLTLPACGGRPVTSNAPLRAGKGSAYEGGVRVPLVVRWPGVTPPGSVCNTPAISIDLYPTILDMVGQADVATHQPDGESLVPLLRQTGPLGRDAIYWHYPHYHPGGATPYSAVRDGDFRLVEFHEDHHVELYRLGDDVGEKSDVSAAMPEKTQQLRQKLADWLRSVAAQMPTPNPDYDPSQEKTPEGRP